MLFCAGEVVSSGLKRRSRRRRRRKVDGGLSLEAPARTSAAVSQPLLLLLLPPSPLPLSVCSSALLLPLRWLLSVASSSAPLNNSEAAGADGGLNPKMVQGGGRVKKKENRADYYGLFFIFSRQPQYK